jgi:8-oxo-dGTP pyrophosphatase MutT (NUDIX family)
VFSWALPACPVFGCGRGKTGIVAQTIESAGGLVWRVSGPRRAVEVLVVHRREHRDWALPKGRLDGDETSLQCALREVLEETGHVCAVGAELPEVCYTDRKGRQRRVRYWSMVARRGRFRPNREIDEVRWLPVELVAEQLSSPHDRHVFDAWREELARVA